jgi:hypothetical protein
MKNRKIFLSILTVVLLLTLLTLPTSALGEIEVAEGLVSLTYNGDEYVRVDSSDISSVNDTMTVYNISFADADEDVMIYAIAYANDSAIELYIDYDLGGSGYYYYVRQDLLDEYNQALSGKATQGEMYLEFDSVQITIPSLRGEKQTIKGYELDAFPNFVGYVYPLCLDGDITLYDKGFVMSTFDGEYFYVDQCQFGKYMNQSELSVCDTVTIWRITDKNIIGMIEDGTFGDFYEDDYNDFGDELNAFIPGLIIFGAALGLLPLAVGIVALIASMKAKAPYKKYLRIVAILCLAAAAVTIATVILCAILA